MGNSCSSGQAHKDKDNMSQKSEESGSYQVRAAIPAEKQQTLLNHVTSKPGGTLEPSSATGVAQQSTPTTISASSTRSSLEKKPPTLSKVLKGVAECSISADSMSLSSPPGVVSPKDLAHSVVLPKEVSKLPENLQNLLTGKISHFKSSGKARKIVIYVCAVDSEDSCVERAYLHNTVYPELRKYCRSKGFELHIVDLHWNSLLEKQQDHELPELCIGEIKRHHAMAHIIPILFLNNSLGPPLLPVNIENSDFNVLLSNAKDKTSQDLLFKWYKLDNAIQPQCYKLLSKYEVLANFRDSPPDVQEKLLDEWKPEANEILEILSSKLTLDMKEAYLTTVIEQELHNLVFSCQEYAKRCIWINRVFTPVARTPENSSETEMELQRRLNTLQQDLRNQLTEKHIYRIAVKYVEGGLNTSEVPEHHQYISQISSHLEKYIKEMIHSLIEEHKSSSILKPYYGIEGSIFEELYQQMGFCQKTSHDSLNMDLIAASVKTYITGDRRTPLVISGPPGCGKTSFLAKIAQNYQDWLPDSLLVLRFVGISDQSNTLEQILSSIAHQCSILAYGHKHHWIHNVESYAKFLPRIFNAICLQKPLIIIIDALDQIKPYSTQSIDWIPQELPENVKLVVSASDNSSIHKQLTEKLQSESFIKIPLLEGSEVKDVLVSNVVQYNQSLSYRIDDNLMMNIQKCSSPFYVKLLAWEIYWASSKGLEIYVKESIEKQLTRMLEQLEAALGVDCLGHALAIIHCTKLGITDSEILDLLAIDDVFHSDATQLPWAPATLIWARLTKYLAPFLHGAFSSEILCVQFKDGLMKQAIEKRYNKHLKWAHQMLRDYFEGKLYTNKPNKNLDARTINQDIVLNNCYNKRKLDELPYQYYQISPGKLPYLNDLSWIYNKVCGSSTYQLLEDFNLQKDNQDEFINTLKDYLENYSSILNYDGRQFYTHLHNFITDKRNRKSIALESNSDLKEAYTLCEKPPVLSLIQLNYVGDDAGEDFGDSEPQQNIKKFDLLVRLPETTLYMVSVSTDNEEICVWDIKSCEKVRTLTGIPHPTNLIPIDKFKCVVLCRRELRIYDLDSGTFLTKLKGVMNQKMPYYGLHDQSHLVALSRNRMYVNLMNLETGDCVTTFKAGEDRFLNSLLVSGDGRMLVCGDETQKPFPLLVWNLQSKKLLYDLRIPHHDFVTALAAITFEGNYVCCVCYEIDEPSPNFIVVYDLQSGTLFKKWKPSCNTVSLEISSQGGCVLSGLEDARILIWDLITGNCRWCLCGHTAPVSMLKLDPTGSLCMSTDVDWRDRSIRIWDINKGDLVAVYTPKSNITACEITLNGRYVVLAAEGNEKILTLQLRGPNLKEEEESKEGYGMEENRGGVYKLSDTDGC